MCPQNKYLSFYILLVMHSVINKHFSSGTDSFSSWLWRSRSWHSCPFPLPSAARRMQPYTVFCVLIWLQLDHHTQCSIFNQLPYILLLFPINYPAFPQSHENHMYCPAASMWQPHILVVLGLTVPTLFIPTLQGGTDLSTALLMAPVGSPSQSTPELPHSLSPF